MTHVLADNVREGSISTGTGPFVTTGGIGAVATVAIGRQFSAVVSVGDTFDYIIHHRTANEWEVGVGTFSGSNTFARTRVVSSSNANAAVNFSAGDKSVWIGPSSEIQDHFAQLANIKTYGATAGGSNSTQINAARVAAGVNRPIVVPSSTTTWGAKASIMDFTADNTGEGSGFSLLQGTTAAPSTNTAPIIYIEKIVNAVAGATNYHTGLDVRTKKVSGTQNAYNAFFAAEDAGGTAGLVTALFSALGVHNANSGGLLYGNLIYVDKTVQTPNAQVRGIDIGIADSSGQDIGWQAGDSVSGTATGMRVYSTGGRSQFGNIVGNAGPGMGFYTGLLIDQDSVLPGSYSTSSEGIRIRGASTSLNNYQGMWFHDGYLKLGINFVGPTYSNSCIILASKGHRFLFGTDNTSGKYFSWTTGDLFDLNGGNYSVSGTQVVGTRKTGWSTPTGTATRTAFATGSVSTAALAQAVKALIEDLTSHGLIGT